MYLQWYQYHQFVFLELMRPLVKVDTDIQLTAGMLQIQNKT